MSQNLYTSKKEKRQSIVVLPQKGGDMASAYSLKQYFRRIFFLFIFILCVVLSNSNYAVAEGNNIDLTSSTTAASGYVVFGMDAERGFSEDWDMDWFFTIRTMNNIPISLGRLDDDRDWNNTKRIVVKLPIGTYQLNVVKPISDLTGMRGSFNYNEQIWVPPTEDYEVVLIESLEVKKDESYQINFGYEQASVKEAKDGNSKIYIAQNPYLNINKENNEDFSQFEFKQHSLVDGGSLEKLNLSNLISLLFKSGKSRDAAVSLMLLEQIDGQMLIGELESTSNKISWEAARVISKTRHPDLVNAVLEKAKAEKIDKLTPTIWVLGELKNNSASSLLVKALSDGDSLQKLYAAYALAQIGDTNISGVLRQAINDTSCPISELIRIRESEFFWYYYLNPQKGWLPMMPLPNYCVDLNVIFALGKLKTDENRDFLIKQLSSNNAKHRAEAAQALSNFDDKKVIDALLERLNDEYPVNLMAITSIAASKSEYGLTKLRSIASKETNEVKKKLITDTITMFSEEKKH